MRTLPWLSLTTMFLLAATGCPAPDDGGQDTDSGTTTGDSDATMTTAPTTSASTSVSTSDSTTDSTTVSTTDSTTVSTTDSTTVSTTESTESSGTDPDTSGTAGTEESEGSSGGSSGNDTGTAVCEPSGDACGDCLFVEHCCAETTACFEDQDCLCLLSCIAEGGDPQGCSGPNECNLNQSPEPFDPLVECLNGAEADCANACG